MRGRSSLACVVALATMASAGVGCGDDGDAGPADDTSSGEGTATESSAESGGASGPTTSDTTGEQTPLGGEWIRLAPLAGGPRQETAVVALGGAVYVLGGFAGGLNVSTAVEVYDPGSDAWSVAADLPAAMHHANAAAIGGQLVIAGFQTGVNFASDGRVFIYDPSADAWTEGTAMPAGTERGASGVAVLGGLMYVVGGSRGPQSVTDAWTYDPAADVWAPLADLPEARNHLIAFAGGGRVFAVGGRDGGNTARVDVYDPASDTWGDAAALPTARAGMAAARIGNLGFVAGGEGNADDPGGVFGQFDAYDFAQDQWHALPDMPTPRHGTGAAAVDGVVYFPGGATLEGLGATDVFEAWVPG